MSCEQLNAIFMDLNVTQSNSNVIFKMSNTFDFNIFTLVFYLNRDYDILTKMTFFFNQMRTLILFFIPFTFRACLADLTSI